MRRPGQGRGIFGPCALGLELSLPAGTKGKAQTWKLVQVHLWWKRIRHCPHPPSLPNPPAFTLRPYWPSGHLTSSQSALWEMQARTAKGAEPQGSLTKTWGLLDIQHQDYLAALGKGHTSPVERRSFSGELLDREGRAPSAGWRQHSLIFLQGTAKK